MKVITKELLQFAAIGGMATILFRWLVTVCINHNSMVWIWPALAVYFCVMFFGAIRDVEAGRDVRRAESIDTLFEVQDV